jgi:hypothetical protein
MEDKYNSKRLLYLSDEEIRDFTLPEDLSQIRFLKGCDDFPSFYLYDKAGYLKKIHRLDGTVLEGEAILRFYESLIWGPLWRATTPRVPLFRDPRIFQTRERPVSPEDLEGMYPGLVPVADWLPPLDASPRPVVFPWDPGDNPSVHDRDPVEELTPAVTAPDDPTTPD